VTSAARRFDVVGVGANSVDLVHILPSSPQISGPSAKMQIREHHQRLGGQTLTTVSTCASFGLRCKYVGVTGSDANGALIRAALTGRDIDVADLIVHDADNQFAIVLIDHASGERIVLWHRDERLLMQPDELPLAALAAARVVHVDDVDDAAAMRAARVGRDAGALVTTDIDRLTPRTGALVAAATHAILAEHVPQYLTGIDDIEAAVGELHRRHGNVICVTLGEHGAVAFDNDGLHRLPAFQVRAVDTTGAGDAFRGGFIYALLRGLPLEQVLRTANAAAALSCTRLGALDSVPTLAEVERLLSAGAIRQ
jgi:sugar/nucleoside kinase (ribokinase family)